MRHCDCHKSTERPPFWTLPLRFPSFFSKVQDILCSQQVQSSDMVGAKAMLFSFTWVTWAIHEPEAGSELDGGRSCQQKHVRPAPEHKLYSWADLLRLSEQIRPWEILIAVLKPNRIASVPLWKPLGVLRDASSLADGQADDDWHFSLTINQLPNKDSITWIVQSHSNCFLRVALGQRMCKVRSLSRHGLHGNLGMWQGKLPEFQVALRGLLDHRLPTRRQLLWRSWEPTSVELCGSRLRRVDASRLREQSHWATGIPCRISWPTRRMFPSILVLYRTCWVQMTALSKKSWKDGSLNYIKLSQLIEMAIKWGRPPLWDFQPDAARNNSFRPVLRRAHRRSNHRSPQEAPNTWIWQTSSESTQNYKK